MKKYVNHQPFMRRIVVLLVGLILLVIPMTTASGLELKITDDSGALGIAAMCSQLIENTSRNPTVEPLLQRIYQAGLQDIKAVKKLGKPDDVAKAIGIIRGAQILGSARNPPLAADFERLAKQCLADIEELKQKKGHGLF